MEHPSLRNGPRPLTIGMATYDDYDGVYFTLQAIRLYHPEVARDIEFVVLDNHPDGPASPLLEKLGAWVKDYKYVPIRAVTGTAVRDCIFRIARTPYVVCVDSHVLLAPGSLRRLIDYFHSHHDTNDLLQGPLMHDSLDMISTHMSPEWRGGMYGTWGADERGLDADGPPFEIPMQGLGVFACRREAWPGFNPRFRGFGAEEGYIHEKFRQAGGRTLCLPFLRWAHRFGRPAGAPYPNLFEDRLRNHIIGWSELGLDIAPAEAHFRELLGEQQFEYIRRPISREIEAFAS